ncbi:MAG: S9 family peptidase [Cellvibrionaceae bacterium]|nr:S9 family peptidase [Cellvibrionaceae bacterium]MCV6624528.1 S9 family peptidase [Cellvibrionaceae bacterium]
MKKLILGVAAMTSVSAVAVEPLTVERLFADPDLSGSAPRSLKLSPDGSRATFLKGRADDAGRMDLWQYQIATGETKLLVDSLALAGGKENELSDEEKARRERARISSLSGIVDYQFSKDGQQLLFPLSGDLFVYQINGNKTKALTQGEGFATDPKFSPKNNYVSFIRERNLWVVETASGQSRPLTRAGKPTEAWGMAEFVAQEEMKRMSGYWWSPNEDAIVAAKFDEAPVPVVKRSEIYAERTEVIEQRYPGAGSNNVLISLAVLDPQNKRPPVSLDLGEEQDIYLARVKWLADGSGILVQRQDRKQQRLDLLLYSPSGGKGKVLLSETSATWVNLHEDLKTLANGNFIWASERSGFKHLYLYNREGKLLNAITSGDWQVDEIEAVDEQKQKIYFSASKLTPLEKQLYRVDFDGNNLKRISRNRGWHNISFSRDASVYIDSWSDDLIPQQVSLHNADGSQITLLDANQVKEGHALFPYYGGLQQPQYGKLQTTLGGDLFYQMLKPKDFDPNKRYPVFLRVYGGPGSQQVQRRWDGRWGLMDQYMAQQGFVVFTLDNRGSERRGKAFEDPIYKAMGGVEVEDQLVGISYLKTLPFVDPERIGVFGWSYGGYMTLLMLAQASDQIAAGVSVAPVTDWMLYDTHYTERYMGLPAENVEGYTNSSVFPHLAGLTSDLYLIHGMADDNVLFSHSTKLMAELQKTGVPFRLMTYPGEKHGITGKGQRSHVFNEIGNYFIERLGK